MPFKNRKGDKLKALLYEQKDITHLACMTHVRRPFAQLIKIAKKPGSVTGHAKNIIEMAEVYVCQKNLENDSI